MDPKSKARNLDGRIGEGEEIDMKSLAAMVECTLKPLSDVG